MRMDEIFLKSCAPQTGLNMSAVDVRSSEHLLLSYMSLPQPWLLCVSLSQAISTAMIVMCFFVTGHFYSHDCYVFLCHKPFLQPWLLCVALSQAISTAMTVMCFFVTSHFYSHDCYVFLCRRPFLQPWLLCVSLLQAISTATIVMCSFAATGFQLMCQKMWMGKVKQSQSRWRMTSSVLYTSGKAEKHQIWVGSTSLSGMETGHFERWRRALETEHLSLWKLYEGNLEGGLLY